MITTSITVAPHLAEYAKAIFKVEDETYIKIPHTDDLYHILKNLMSKRPEGAPIQRGNLEIALPHQSKGKCPLTYNYISDRGAVIIERKLQALFWAHLHSFVDDYRHSFKKQEREYLFFINDCVCMFMFKYNITSISEDALIKNYYRWRSHVRRKLKKRNYTKTE